MESSIQAMNQVSQAASSFFARWLPDWIAEWVAPAIILVAAWLLGLLIERVVLGRLKAFAARSQGGLGHILITAIAGMPLLWVSLLGLFIAAGNMPISGANAGYMHAGIKVLLILSVTLVVARAAVALLQHALAKVDGFGSSTILAMVLRIGVFTVGLLVAFQSINVEIAPILTALGVGGLAVALALQDTLSNLFSGIQLLLTRKIRVGDTVHLDSGEEGVVEDISWRHTAVRTLVGNLVIVPNGKLAGAVVTNFSLPEKPLRMVVPCSVAYGSDLDRVERTVIEVATEIAGRVAGGLVEPAPVMRFTAFADSAITFNIVLTCREYADQFLLRHELIKAIHARFAADGIEIPFPQHVVTIRPTA